MIRMQKGPGENEEHHSKMNTEGSSRRRKEEGGKRVALLEGTPPREHPENLRE